LGSSGSRVGSKQWLDVVDLTYAAGFVGAAAPAPATAPAPNTQPALVPAGAANTTPPALYTVLISAQ